MVREAGDAAAAAAMEVEEEVGKKRGRPPRGKKLEPVTEAYTQLDDGFELSINGDDDQNAEAGDDIEPPKKASSSRKASPAPASNSNSALIAAKENLKAVTQEYSKKHRNSDPLSSALASSPSPVVSHAVAKGKETEVSPLTDSPVFAPPTKSPSSRRMGIIQSRTSAQQVYRVDNIYLY